MENQTKDRTVTIAIVTGLIALLLGICGGAAVGGLAGYTLGRQAAVRGQTNLGPNPFTNPIPAVPRPGAPIANGVVIQEVVSGSPADQAGLQVGDIITVVDGKALDANTRLNDLLASHKPGDQVGLTLNHFGTTRTVRVTLGSYPGDNTRPYLGIRYTQSAVEQATPNP